MSFLGIYFVIGLLVSIVMLILFCLDEGGFDWKDRDTYSMIGSVVAFTAVFWPVLLLWTCGCAVHWFFSWY